MMFMLLRLIFIILLPLTCAATAHAGGDWTGKTILLKGVKTVKIGLTDDKGRQVYLAELKGIDYRVIKEQGGWLKVAEKGVEGWFDKADAVVLEQAVDYFTGRIRTNAKDDQAFAYRAMAWQLKGELDIAIKDHDEALRLAPNEEDWWHNRGTAWSNKKDYDKAIKDYGEAIRLDPKHVLAYYNRGTAWSNKKDYDKAIKDYGEAIRLDPKYVLAYYNRGTAWSNKKDYDKAIKDYGEAIRLDPKYVLAYALRGAAWSNKKDYDKAIKDCDEAIRLDPKHAWAHLNRSVALMLMRRPEAAGGFQGVLDLDDWKQDPAPYAVILGHLAARQAEDEARAQRFLKDSAGKLDAVWPFPVVKFLRDEIDESALMKLATDDDKQTEARCYLGMDHALRGRKNQALAHFRWVKEHGNTSFIEYTIALAELERLESDAMKSKR